MKKICCLLFTLVTLAVSAFASEPGIIAPKPVENPTEDVCNLSAVSNLVNTNTTFTSLSYAWDALPGATGFDAELTDVATNTVVFTSNNQAATTLTVGGLTPGKYYRLDIWGICPNKERGANANRTDKTYGIIIDDLFVGFDGGHPVPGNHFQLFQNNNFEESPKFFEVSRIGTNDKEVFKVRKEPSSLLASVRFSQQTAPGESSSWILANEEFIYPQPDSIVPANEVKVNYYINYSILMTVQGSNGYSYLDWSLPDAVTGFEVRQFVPGAQGGGGSDTRSDMDTPQDQGFTIAPNPFTEALNIHSGASSKIQLMDINGRIVFESATEADQTISIPTGHLSNGIYVVRYETATEIKTFKVAKTK